MDIPEGTLDVRMAPSQSILRNPPAYEDDDDYDETLGERLVGLLEMFPESVRDRAAAGTQKAVTATKTLFNFLCSTSWVIATSGTLLLLPIMLEQERVDAAVNLETQQQQILLGPGAAMAGGARGSSAFPSPIGR